MQRNQLFTLHVIAAAMMLASVGAGPALATGSGSGSHEPCQQSDASGSSGPNSTQASGAARDNRGRVTALMQRQINRAGQEMRRAARSVAVSSEKLLESLDTDPRLANLCQLSDDEINALADVFVGMIDGYAAEASARIDQIDARTEAALTSRKAPQRAFDKLNKLTDGAKRMTERISDRMADKLDRLLAHMLEDCDAGSSGGSDDSGGSGSGDSAGGGSGSGGSGG